jgi:hypothetical protein
MSLPYLRIDNVSYSTASNTLSVSLKALRIRGYDSENDIIIEGFSQSKVIPISNGFFEGTVTYSIPDLETSTASVSPTTTFVAPSVSLIISGTAVNGNGIQLSTELGNLVTLPFTTTQSGASVSQLLAATISSNGFSAVATNNVLTVSAPWGSYYNGLNFTITASASLSATIVGTSSVISEFAGGVTQYNLLFRRQNPVLGILGVNQFNFSVGTYSLGS